jgi:hypothetical protein
MGHRALTISQQAVSTGYLSAYIPRKMTRNRSAPHRWRDNPGILVHGIQNIGDLWSKLDWEVDQFEVARFSNTPDPFSMSFVAANVCITLDSLQDWFRKNLVRESRHGDADGIRPMRQKDESWTDETASDLVRQRISHEAIFRNVANTAKHGAFRSEGVEDLHARMTAHFRDDLQCQLDALDEENGAEFILANWNESNWRLTYHAGRDGDVELDAFQLFSTARNQWSELLKEFDWAD